MDKEYYVPEDLAVFIDKLLAAEDMRDRCIKFPFGYRRARESARDVYYFRRKFWTGIHEIYPELKSVSTSYDANTQKVKVKEADPAETGTNAPSTHGDSVCLWTEDKDSVWETTCGHSFIFNDGGPHDNEFEFCPYCGQRIRVGPAQTAGPSPSGHAG